MARSFSESELGELARVYHRKPSATSLLDRAGIKRESQPGWGSHSSLDFWREVGEEVESGRGGSNAVDRILAIAAEEYPGNAVFRRSAGDLSSGSLAGGGRAADPFGSSGTSGSPAPLSVLGTIVVVDAVGFSKNGALLHLEWRKGIGTITAQAAAIVGIAADLMHFNDRGDGFMLIIDGRIPAETVVVDFTRELRIALGEYNRTRNSAGRIRLRIAVHEGRAFVDGTGLAGTPAINTARLVDADELRSVLKQSDGPDTALIVSDVIYQSTVTERLRGLDPDDFVRVEVKTEKYQGVAWIAGREDAGAARVARPGEETRPMAGEQLSVPEPATGRWDFLISCTDDDADWGQWIAHQLQVAKYKVHLDAFDMVPGTARVERWHDAVRYSARTIAVLSESYLTATREIQSQWQEAWRSDGAAVEKTAGGDGAAVEEAGIERRLIPVVVRPCSPDGLLGGITPIDLTSRRGDRDLARQYLLEEIEATLTGRRRKSDSAPPFPGDA
ncbi:toll/interleukin-1 receptor domain-containing protein [Frankia sp. Mgl5]|uniref:toll/interleukin-1 receptor domain-containing protein n=1 Tax=Frankia sp. Mgl5 TaxID=2933793 RepID=UPI00200E2AD9|nr:toll/interleukin-1 receptor domain-containing protein [Frankia sp. Mgl5]MCK9929190.1 toll/interleukin-1 receptor domain-containing protein [Frankia sp. Mgl5]